MRVLFSSFRGFARQLFLKLNPNQKFFGPNPLKHLPKATQATTSNTQYGSKPKYYKSLSVSLIADRTANDVRYT